MINKAKSDDFKLKIKYNWLFIIYCLYTNGVLLNILD